MSDRVAILQQMFDLDFVEPFVFEATDGSHSLRCLIRGYGASRGMVVDADWSKLKAVADQLTDAGYGYSSLDIDSSDTESFKDVLDDWGVNDA